MLWGGLFGWLQAQMGSFTAVSPSSSAESALQQDQLGAANQQPALLPKLMQGGVLATTVSAASGHFRLVAVPTAQYGGLGLATALRCRAHGIHVGLAVSYVGGADELAHTDEAQEQGGGLSDSDDSSGTSRSVSNLGVTASTATSSSGSSCSSAAPPMPFPDALDVEAEVALKVWAPQAALQQAKDGPCLYQFELSLGEEHCWSEGGEGGGGGRMITRPRQQGQLECLLLSCRLPPLRDGARAGPP